MWSALYWPCLPKIERGDPDDNVTHKNHEYEKSPTFYLESICTFWSKIVDGIKKTFEDVKEKLDSQALMHFRCRLVPIDKIENRDQTFGFDHDPEKSSKYSSKVRQVIKG